MVRNLPAKQETKVWSLGQENPLEKEMTAHSSILAWRIPWTEEPGGVAESDTTEGLNSSKHFQAQTHTVYGSQNITGKISCGQANQIRQ